jgi:hypothetical protein
MTSPSREFHGQIQAGGLESAAPWVQATLTMTGNSLRVVVNQAEVALLTDATISDTGQNDIFLIEGADQPLYFRPQDANSFRTAIATPMTTAERIAAASAVSESPTLIMEDGVPQPVPPSDPPPTSSEPTKSTRSWWVIIIVIAVVLLLLIAFCGGGEAPGTTTTTLEGTTTSSGDTTSTSAEATTTTAPETTTSAPVTTTTAPTTTVSVPEPAFGAGTHVVGEDIQPGVYETGIVDGLFGCYWERLSGLSGEFDDIIANNNVTNHDVVEIMGGDAGFSSDCDAWFPLTPLDTPLTAIPEGKWVVNTHIVPGTYEASGGSCYWERLSGLSGEFDDIIANDNPTGQAVVEIDGGDVAFNSSGCGEWTSR